MNICPTCQHQVMPGALYCSECGGSIFTAIDESSSQPSFGRQGPPDCTGLALRVIDTGDVIRLNGRQQVTLGRSSTGQPILPDVDLGPFNGYEAGVSRLHAAIQVQAGQLFVQDLGSANGTRLNGKRMESQQVYSISPGDIITLGKLKVQIVNL